MTPDFLVIGGGILGINVAHELKRRFEDASVHVIDKEASGTEHASGRNSGVVHAGFYYTADSHKAALCREGNRLLTAYCLERGLPLNRCGKLVVTTHEAELEALDELFRRGEANGVELQEVTEAEAREIEPRARTVQRALYSPTTASVDPVAVVQAMQADAEGAGVVFHHRTAYLRRQGHRVVTSEGVMEPGYVVNAAGLYADRIARDFGFSEPYRILPFKGLYLHAEPVADPIQTHIYPVPHLANPFLGVHFTVTVDGHVKLGPTATPAFWREQYGGLGGFAPGELFEILGRQTRLLVGSDFAFGRLAWSELRKVRRSHLVGLASALADGVAPDQYRRWGRPGIRAQLLDIRTQSLVMDFVFEGDARSLHILNAVSPGLTCSIPFSRHVCDQISERLP